MSEIVFFTSKENNIIKKCMDILSTKYKIYSTNDYKITNQDKIYRENISILYHINTENYNIHLDLAKWKKLKYLFIISDKNLHNTESTSYKTINIIYSLIGPTYDCDKTNIFYLLYKYHYNNCFGYLPFFGKDISFVPDDILVNYLVNYIKLDSIENKTINIGYKCKFEEIMDCVRSHVDKNFDGNDVLRSQTYNTNGYDSIYLSIFLRDFPLYILYNLYGGSFIDEVKYTIDSYKECSLNNIDYPINIDDIQSYLEKYFDIYHKKINNDDFVAQLISIIPEPIRELLDDLKYAISLPSGSKLSITDKKYSGYSLYETISRQYKGESRYKTIIWLNECIDRAISIIKKYPAWKDIITEHIVNLENCLTNLSGIYRDDPSIVSKIGVIKLRIRKDIFLETFSKRNSDGSKPIDIIKLTNNLNEDYLTPHS